MLLFSFFSVAAVVYTPAYPELAKQLHLSNTQAQWIMTLFMLGGAFGRLPYGPLGNRLGRKKTLLIGLFVCLLGTVMILSAQGYLFICLGRVIQALGAAVCLKIGYTMIGDVYTGIAATKLLAYANLFYAVLPGISTAISGALVSSYGWRGGFWFFLLFTLLVLILSCFLPETAKKIDPKALQIGKIACGYAEQLKNPDLLMWGSLMGLSTAILYMFAQQAPFIAIEEIGMSPLAYGSFYLIPAFGIVGGSVLTAWMAHRINTHQGMLLGILITLLGSLGLGLLIWWPSVWTLFLPQLVIQFGDIVLYTNASSETLSRAQDKSNASAIVLFVNSLIAMVGTFLIGTLAPRSLASMPIAFLLIGGMMLVIWRKLLTSKTKSS
jgi:DHA1 family bicyclomycin/chloramphenicol resistance-like MFS transporter